jgi:hypothetical protein
MRQPKQIMFASFVLIVAIALQTPPVSNQQETPPEQKQRSTENSQPTTSINAPTAPQENKTAKQSQWWPPPPLWDIYWPTLALVILAGIGAKIALATLDDIKEQTAATKKAADAASMNAQALIASERAWIDLELTPQTDAPSMYDLKITNHGRTPALVLTYTVGTQSYPPDEYLWSTAKTFDMMKASYKKLADLRVFLKQSDSHSANAVTDLSHAFLAWDAVRNGQQSGLLYFGVSYLDIVSGTEATREPRESAAIFSFVKDSQSLYRMARYDKYK